MRFIFILNLSLFICFSAAKAQIVYVDVNPDSCTCITASSPTSSDSAITYWDLDHDNVYDFKIKTGTYMPDCMHGNEFATLTPLANNQVAYGSVGILILNSGDTINNQLMGTVSKLEYFSEFSGWSGFWNNSYPNRFAGIKFYSGSNLYYGWIKLSVFTTCGQA